MTAEPRAHAATKEALDALEAERDAALLPMIKAALERRHVTDFKVWGGSRPFVEGDERIDRDEEIDWDEANDLLIKYEGISYTRGMFRCLGSYAREDPSGQTIRAIRIAFALGQASITGTTDPEKIERFLAAAEKQSAAVRKAGTITGSKKAAKAEQRNQVLKEVWRRYRDQFGDGLKLAEKIEDGECKYVDESGKEKVYKGHLSVERMRDLFRKWATEVVIATEPETWATSGWERWGSTHHRSTHDGYRAQLFETDGRWDLEMAVQVVADKPPRNGVAAARGYVRYRGVRMPPGVSLDDAKAASYRFIEQERLKGRQE
jgi:hypothetical protein